MQDSFFLSALLGPPPISALSAPPRFVPSGQVDQDGAGAEAEAPRSGPRKPAESAGMAEGAEIAVKGPRVTRSAVEDGGARIARSVLG
jgi:hypothetical protein